MKKVKNMVVPDGGKKKKVDSEVLTEKHDLEDEEKGVDEGIEDIEDFDPNEIVEIIEFGNSGEEAIRANSRPSEDDDDSEDVRRLFENPKRITSRPIKRNTISADYYSSDEISDEGARPIYRQLITTCRYCGDLFKFRSDQSKPSCCGKLDCIMKMEKKAEMAGSVK